MNKLSVNGLSRISKQAAKKLYNNNIPIYFNPSKLTPFSAWGEPFEIHNDGMSTFESRVNSFEYYNCTNETGLYTMFFKKD